MRALTKIAINLISDTCESTRVDSRTFPEAISFVLSGSNAHPSMFRDIGFVCPNEVAELHRNDAGHAFRIHFDRRTWTVYSSFFGGRVCSVVRMPGVSSEDWTSCDISTSIPVASAPAATTKWEILKSSLLRPISVKAILSQPDKITPYLKLINSHTFLDVRERPRPQ
jgi:hypothetical protein